MTQIPYFNPSIPQDFKDRKGGLIAFGIVMIVIGALCGCMGLVMPLSLALQTRAGGPTPSAMGRSGLLAAIPLYVALAATLIWCGIGSIQSRRWVRPIVLIFSTIWLCTGAVAFLVTAIAMSNVQSFVAAQRAATSGPAVPTAFVAIGSIIAIFFTFIIYVAIPGVIVWFYRTVDVQRTLAFYDPVERWTDRIPLPVLGMSVGCALIAAGLLLATLNPMIWVFGVFVSGIGASGILLTLTGIFAAAAVLTYRRKMSGWALAVAAVGITQASIFISSFFYDAQKIGAAMEATTQEMEMLRASAKLVPLISSVWPVILGVAAIVYAIRIRHYFQGSAPAPLNPTIP